MNTPNIPNIATRPDGDLRLVDWFCGAGGSTQGAIAVPGVRPVHAANHWAQAIETHAANFPTVEHWRGDIRDVDVARLPYAELFWASPECTNWSRAKGRRQDYATSDLALPGLEEPAPTEEVERSRALMEEVPLYLRAMALRGRPVLAGVVENVVDIRAWTDWDRWRAEIEAVGYRSRLVALNSMHAQSVVTPRAPQSRDRLYLAYWHVSLGRDPDWDKWLRPAAWCPTCGTWTRAVQVFKTPGRDMGRYRSQYVYRCPATSCRRAVVEPAFTPAAAVIDWTLPAQRIGDRERPLAAKTVARIATGIRRYARPVPLLVPVEGRDGKTATTTVRPLRTQSTRSETALVTGGNDLSLTVAPFVAELRGGGSVARPVSDPLATVTASGNHHGLVTPDNIVGQVLTLTSVPDQGHGKSRHLRAVADAAAGREPLDPASLPAVEDCRFRMLEPAEILAGMAFTPAYRVLGNRRERVRQAGNAVTPPAAEVLISALVEAITGQHLDPAPLPTHLPTDLGAAA